MAPVVQPILPNVEFHLIPENQNLAIVARMLNETVDSVHVFLAEG